MIEEGRQKDQKVLRTEARIIYCIEGFWGGFGADDIHLVRMSSAFFDGEMDGCRLDYPIFLLSWPSRGWLATR